MKKALTVFFVTLITSASFAVSAAPINVYQCMYNCGYEGLSMAACKRICGVP